jgi:glutamate racemase
VSTPSKKIGVFDSGYGGLTVLKEIVKQLPQYDYLYLGDNARAPYGTRSFETVYEYTLECVKKLFELDCELVLLACNTASAKALRTIQQKDLLSLAPNKRVLGVIRPTTEIVGNYTKTNVVGVLGTSGTITSNSYPIEIEKFYPQLTVVQEACPMWVPLVENNEFESEGADYFIQKNLNSLLEKGKNIDTIILGCTHYPLLINKIKKFLPEGIKLISQGEIVATSLIDYLNRHAEIEQQLSKGKSIQYLTTDSSENFDKAASIFVGEPIQSKHIDL